MYARHSYRVFGFLREVRNSVIRRRNQWLRIQRHAFVVSVAIALMVNRNVWAAEFYELGDFETVQPNSISNNGIVVGSTLSNGSNVREPFRWSAMSGFTMGFLRMGDEEVTASTGGISADGSTIGGSFLNDNNQTEAFRWTAEDGIVSLGFLGPWNGENFRSGAGPMSPDGSVVFGTTTSPNSSREIFRWTESTGMTSLGTMGGPLDIRPSWVAAASPDGSVAVGWASSNQAEGFIFPFRWDEQNGLTQLDFPNEWKHGMARDVAADNTTIVGFLENNGDFLAGIWRDETGFTPLPVRPDDSFRPARATNISSDGEVIMGSGYIGETRPANNFAFIWTEDDGIRKVQDVLISDFGLASSLEGWQVADVIMSNNGRFIIGYGYNPGGITSTFVVDLAANRDPSNDFNGDGILNSDDIDALTLEIVGGTNNPQFDLTSDGIVDVGDLEQWLDAAAIENGFAAPFLLGDANLDGTVNAADLNKVGLHWEQSLALWSAGDFNADGSIGAPDLNSLGQNWLQTIAPAAEMATIPEPAASWLLRLGLVCLPVVLRTKRKDALTR